MELSNIINFVLVAITGLGVWIAIWAALDARGAREDARTARDEAKEYERRALTASESSAQSADRSASALEERNEIERSRIPTEPWELRQHDKEKFEVVNISKDTMFAVYIDDLGEGNDITPFEDGGNVGPGESLFFNYSKTFTSPAQTTVQVNWGDPMSGERSYWRKTIS